MRIPKPPDILSPWRTRILESLAAHGLAADVGPKRPADVVNLSKPFVRIMCLGGPWDHILLWRPRLAAESWPGVGGVLEAHELESVVAYATALMEGYEQHPTPQGDGFRITECALALQGADQTVDGAPLVLTTTDPLCVQVIQMKEVAR